MKLEPVIEEIRKRLDLLQLRYSIIWPKRTVPSPEAVSECARDVAESLARRDVPAVHIVRALVDPADLAGHPFWSTPLGRLLFAAGGYPCGEMTQATAATVLNLSRQRVHQLVLSGALRSETGGIPSARMVRAGDVCDLLRHRI